MSLSLDNNFQVKVKHLQYSIYTFVEHPEDLKKKINNMKYVRTFEQFINEKYTHINEASFTEDMDSDTLELYREYRKQIDNNDITDHGTLDKALKNDTNVRKNKQKRLLQKALAWVITFNQRMER